MKHHDEINLRRKGFVGYCFHTIVLYQRVSGQELKQNRNLEADADAEGIEGTAYWLTPHDFLIEPRNNSQRWDHQQWAGPSSINP